MNKLLSVHDTISTRRLYVSIISQGNTTRGRKRVKKPWNRHIHRLRIFIEEGKVYTNTNVSCCTWIYITHLPNVV